MNVSSYSSGPIGCPPGPVTGLAAQLVTRPVEGAAHLGGRAAQVVDAVVFRGPRVERVEPGLEGVVLGDVVLVPDTGRVHRAVEHHPADPAGEQRAVHLAQVGAPGEPVVGDLLHAERLAYQVHVAGHVHAGLVGQQPAEPLLAVRRVRLRLVDEHLLRRRVRRDVVRLAAGEVAGIAAQRRHRSADPAWVEADDVVVRGHLRTEAGGGGAGQPPAWRAGAAGVDEHHALLLALRRRRGDHGKRDRDLAAAGVRVVQRDLERGALHPGELAPACGPAQRAARGSRRDDARRPRAAARAHARARGGRGFRGASGAGGQRDGHGQCGEGGDASGATAGKRHGFHLAPSR